MTQFRSSNSRWSSAILLLGGLLLSLLILVQNSGVVQSVLLPLVESFSTITVHHQFTRISEFALSFSLTVLLFRLFEWQKDILERSKNQYKIMSEKIDDTNVNYIIEISTSDEGEYQTVVEEFETDNNE